jgi:hypothetical protein
MGNVIKHAHQIEKREGEIMGMYREGSMMQQEQQYICDVCGRKKGISSMAGKCVRCGRYVCSTCGTISGDRVYCNAHKPGCFIATAAYGSPMAPEIQIIREYRNRVMSPSGFGRALIKFYYSVSPPIARVISRSDEMRKHVRFYIGIIIKNLKK